MSQLEDAEAARRLDARLQRCLQNALNDVAGELYSLPGSPRVAGFSSPCRTRSCPVLGVTGFWGQTQLTNRKKLWQNPLLTRS